MCRFYCTHLARGHSESRCLTPRVRHTLSLHVQVLLTLKHSVERLEHVWHVTGAFTIPELKTAVETALKEYFLEGNLEEATRCVRELHVPHFLHEVVYRALVLTLNAWPAKERAELAIKLLHHFRVHQIVTEYQCLKGFQRCQANLDDIALDAPQAREAFAFLVSQAVEMNILAKGAITPAA